MFEHTEEKEAVKIAALIEKNGYAFYKALSVRVEDGEIRDTLNSLAEEEKKHMQVIENHYYPEAGFEEMVTDEELDMEEHVCKTADPGVFTRSIDMEQLVYAIDTVKKALLLALHAERYAAQFFEGMAERAFTEDGRRMYEELVEEEREHARRLERLL